MSAPSPVTSMQTPQREFAGAKVLLFFELTKCFMIFLQWGIVFLFYTVEPSALLFNVRERGRECFKFAAKVMLFYDITK